MLIDGVPAARVGAQVDISRPVTLKRPDFPWVGRGALKLLGCLDPLGVDPDQVVCADLGSSTGGFTEVLLSRGAARVYAIDVGRGLMHWRLRTDERVVLMEGVNARYIESLPDPIDLLVGDLSFISLSLMVPVIMRLVRPGGEAVVLVKPQFEAGRSEVGAGGKVRSPRARTAAIERVARSATDGGLVLVAGLDSTVAGARAGNVEHFLHLRRP